MTRTQIDRRDFLRSSAAAAASISLPCLIPSHVLGAVGQPGANEQVRVGVIGCGGRSRLIREGGDVKGFQVVAACDCRPGRAEGFVKELSGGREWGVYQDFRQMIDKEKLDAVMIETTTHARAWIAILAMQAGMDAYIEKPMCLTIAEGREMVRAARKYRRVTQVGTQQRSMPSNNWASDLVKNGALGKIKTVRAPNFVGPFRWTKTTSADVKGPVDPWWDLWTNQAELRPLEGELLNDWARWRDYDGGGLCFGVTGWGAHSYDQINRALGTDDTGPAEIILDEPVAERETGKFAPRKSVGGVIVGDTGDIDTGTDYHGMARLSGPRAKVTMKFAGGTELKLELDGDRGPGLGAIFIGEQGKIEINRDKIASNPAEIVRAKEYPGKNRRAETAYHIENWIECIKSRKLCNADIEIGQRATTLCYLVNIVREIGRVGEALKWDPAAERFANCEEANKLLSRPRRKAFELPNLA
ncbi:MAG: Gfo/Idh/MocA family oxidoreductase [Thermoguttaceae bacterium]